MSRNYMYTDEVALLISVDTENETEANAQIKFASNESDKEYGDDLHTSQQSLSLV